MLQMSSRRIIESSFNFGYALIYRMKRLHWLNKLHKKFTQDPIAKNN